MPKPALIYACNGLVVTYNPLTLNGFSVCTLVLPKPAFWGWKSWFSKAPNQINIPFDDLLEGVDKQALPLTHLDKNKYFEYFVEKGCYFPSCYLTSI